MVRWLGLFLLLVVCSVSGYQFLAVQSLSEGMASLLPGVCRPSAIEVVCDGEKCAHARARVTILGFQAAQVNPRILFLGDSNTEALVVPARLCEQAVLNAGVGGANSAFISAMLPEFLTNAGGQVGMTVLAVGTNDAVTGAETPVADFAANVRRTVDILRRNGSQVLLVTVPPVEQGRPLGDAYFSMQHIGILNEALRRVAQEESVTVVEGAARFSSSEGWAIPGSTFDGVHFTSTSHRRWLEEVTHALEDSDFCRRQAIGQGAGD